MVRGKQVFVGYARTTGVEEANGHTLQQQIEGIKKYAQDEGITLYKIYWDRGIPGQPRSFRSGIFTLLDDIPIVGITDILASQVDRMIRGGEIGRQILKELETQKIAIHSLTEDQSKVKQDTRRITASTVAALKSANTKIRALKRGKAPAGRAPYGYRRIATPGESTTTLEVVEDEAKVVQWIFREYLRRRSMAKVAKGLAEQNIPAPGGKQWSRASVAWILGNEIYIGNVKFGRHKEKGEHTAIIAPVVFHKVQKLRQTNRRMRKTKEEGEGDTTRIVEQHFGPGDGSSSDPFAAFDARMAVAEDEGASGDASSADTETIESSDDADAEDDSGKRKKDDFVFEPLGKGDDADPDDE